LNHQIAGNSLKDKPQAIKKLSHNAIIMGGAKTGPVESKAIFT
jgi:hypothetical protein